MTESLYGWKTGLLLIVLVLAAMAACPLAGQTPRASSWETELVGGAGADLIARGPWMAHGVRTNAVARVGFATGLSLFYEYVVEPWNQQTNAAHFQDVEQRFVGTIAAEVVIVGLKKVVRLL